MMLIVTGRVFTPFSPEARAAPLGAGPRFLVQCTNRCYGSRPQISSQTAATKHLHAAVHIQWLVSEHPNIDILLRENLTPNKVLSSLFLDLLHVLSSSHLIN
jgi:hypothetical protein